MQKRKKKASSSHSKQLKNMQVVCIVKPSGTENTQAANQEQESKLWNEPLQSAPLKIEDSLPFEERLQAAATPEPVATLTEDSYIPVWCQLHMYTAVN